MSETVNQNNSLDDSLAKTEPTVESNQKSDIKDNGAEVEDSSPNKKIKLSNDVNDGLKPPSAGRPGRPSKAKRLNILEKTAKEGEVLLQNLGHKADDDPDNTRRRTRSQTRGTPPVPTPPKKAAPKSPKSPQKDNSSSGTPKRRGRPPKNSITNNSVENKTENNANSETKTETNDTTEESNESQEKSVNNTSETNNTDEENASEQTNNAVPDAVDESEDKESAEVNEQTNDLTAKDVKTKANSISGDTSTSVPVIDTQPVPQTN